MKSFKQHLKEGPSQDAAFRGEAATVWFKMLRAIEDGAAMQQAMSSNPRRAILDLGKSIGDARYSPLKILFVPHRGASGGSNGQFGFEVGSNSTKPIISLNGIDAETLRSDQKFLEFLLMYRAKYSTTFAHEFTHYLDWKRLGPKAFDAAGSELQNREEEPTPAMYFNNNIESNAFYQAGLAAFEHALQTAKMWPDEESSRDLMAGVKTFNGFEKIVLPYFRDQFLQYLSAEGKRRMTSRLYQYWSENFR